jgi:hypothetical protein
MPCVNPGVTIETVASISDLPPDAAFLADRVGDLFGSRIWWETVADNAMPANAVACFIIARIAGAAVALFPMRAGEFPAAFDGLSTPYTCLYSPSVADGLGDAGKLAVFAAFGRLCRRWGTVRLDAMPADWPDLALLIAGLNSARLVVRRFDHFGNWHASVAGSNWDRYLAGRPEKRADTAFAVYAAPAAIEAGIAAFESVYARSWKESEPFPAFNAALMRATAGAGWARIGVWSVAGMPIAAQFWVVDRERATVLKLAHDEAFKAHSPGTILTASMLRQLLNEEKVAEIDFGRGDDAYKEGWTGQRRQRIGLILINPLRWRGA